MGIFDGKVAIITGGGKAKSIGYGIAVAYAKEGADLVLTGRNEQKLLDAKEELERLYGIRVLALQADVTPDDESEDRVKEVVRKTIEVFGRIDVLINNVGGTIWARPFAEYQPEQIEKEIRRSLFPTLWGCRAALPWMLKQGKGSIVNISSVATAGVNRVPYSAAKGGVNALTRSIAMEYSGSGIRINAVAPGGTEAPPRLTPRNEEQPSEQEKAWYQQVVDQTVASSLLHRYGTLAEQANAILFLASDEASYITGVTLPVAGGDLG